MWEASSVKVGPNKKCGKVGVFMLKSYSTILAADFEYLERKFLR